MFLWSGRSFTEEDMIAMDKSAIAKMAEVHPERDLVAKMRSELERRKPKQRGIAPPPSQPEHPLPTFAEAAERFDHLMKAIAARASVDPSLGDICSEVALRHGMTVLHLKSVSRNKAIIPPRHEAMYLCAELTKKSLPCIGKFFGGRDHTTVLHAVRQHGKRIGVPALPRGIPWGKS